MTHTRTDPSVLAETLRQWALRLLAALVELLSFGPFARPVRRWAHAQAARAERGVMALVVLAAVRKAPYLPPPLKRAARPWSAARGFRQRATRAVRVAQMARGLFQRERDVVARVRRLAATLADIDAATAPVLHRLARTPLFAVLVMVAAPAVTPPACADAVVASAPDTS